MGRATLVLDVDAAAKPPVRMETLDAQGLGHVDRNALYLWFHSELHLAPPPPPDRDNARSGAPASRLWAWLDSGARRVDPQQPRMTAAQGGRCIEPTATPGSPGRLVVGERPVFDPRPAADGRPTPMSRLASDMNRAVQQFWRASRQARAAKREST